MEPPVNPGRFRNSRSWNAGERDTLGQSWAFLQVAQVAGGWGGGANSNVGFRGQSGRSADGLHHTGFDNCITGYGKIGSI